MLPQTVARLFAGDGFFLPGLAARSDTMRLPESRSFPKNCKMLIRHLLSQIPNSAQFSETILSYQTLWSDTP